MTRMPLRATRGTLMASASTNSTEYFSNLEWEFRVFALNSVWKREVQSSPLNYDGDACAR